MSRLIWLIAGGFIVLLIVPPLAWLVVASLSHEGGVSLHNYWQLLAEPRLRQAVLNTIILSCATAVISTMVAAPAAWAVSRSNMPFRRTIRIFVLITFVTPPFLGAVAWLLMTGSGNGFFNIYSKAGLVFVLVLYQYPISFIIISSALDSVGSDMEFVARNMGAGTLRVAASITLPLTLPALVGSGVLALLDTASLYGTPAMLAIPAGYHVLSTQIVALFQYPPQTELAAALSTPLLLATALLIYLQRRIMGRRSFTTISGKSVGRHLVDVGPWRYVLFLYCATIITLSTVLPYLFLIRASLSRNRVLPFEGNNITLDNFVGLMTNRGTAQSIWNSLFFAAVSATIAIVLTGLIAYAAERKTIRWSGVLVFLCLIPIALPGVALATGILVAYAGPPFSLYGTMWILIVAYVAKALPLGFMASRSTVGAVGVDLERSARVLGASPWKYLLTITAPLMRAGLLAGWALLFMSTIRELSASVLLYTPHSRVLSVRFLTYATDGSLEGASALGIVLLALTFLTVGVAYVAFGKNVLELSSGR